MGIMGLMGLMAGRRNGSGAQGIARPTNASPARLAARAMAGVLLTYGRL